MTNIASINKQKQSTLYFTILSAICIWLITYAYAVLSPALSHDALNILDAPSAPIHTHVVGLGRFLIPFLTLLRGNITAPWIIGLLALLWETLTIIVLAKLFSITHKALLLLLSAIVIAAPSNILTMATYILDADLYAFSLFCAVLSVYIWAGLRQIHYKHIRAIHFCAIIGLLVLSLSVYQAQVMCFCVVVSLWCIQYLSTKNKDDLKSCWLAFGSAVVALAMALVLWYALAKIIAHLVGIPLSTDYNGITGVFTAIQTIDGDRIKTALRIFVQAFGFTAPFAQKASYYASATAYGSCMLFVVAFLFFIVQAHPKPSRILSQIILIAILIFSSIWVFLISTEATHELMYTGMYLLYLCPLCMLQRVHLKKLIQNSGIVLLGFIYVSFILFANQVFFMKNIEADAGIATATRLLAKLDTLNNYEPGVTEVYIVGTTLSHNLQQDSPQFDRLKNNVGLWSIFPGTHQEATWLYFNYYLGQKVNLIEEYNEETASHLLAAYQAEIATMPTYPANGSIRQIDNNTIIVKIDDLQP